MRLTKEDYKIADRNRIDRKTLYMRVNVYGWDKQRALSTKTLKLEERNKKYPDWVYEKLKENNIPRGTFYVRVNEYKWSIEEACTIPKGGRRKIEKNR